MSHVSSYKTDVRLDNALSEGRSVEEDPGWEVLNEAVLVTAEEYNLDVTHSIRDYYGRSIACDWGLLGPVFPRGLGVKVDRSTGEVSFIADTYGGFERTAGEIKERLMQNYATLCVTRALRELNYKVEIDEFAHPLEGKKVLVKGVL